MRLKPMKPSLMLAVPWDKLLPSSGEVHAQLGRDADGRSVMRIEGFAFTPAQLNGLRWRVVRATPTELEQLRRSPYLPHLTGFGLGVPR